MFKHTTRLEEFYTTSLTKIPTKNYISYVNIYEPSCKISVKVLDPEE